MTALTTHIVIYMQRSKYKNMIVKICILCGGGIGRYSLGSLIRVEINDGVTKEFNLERWIVLSLTVKSA